MASAAGVQFTVAGRLVRDLEARDLNDFSDFPVFLRDTKTLLDACQAHPS